VAVDATLKFDSESLRSPQYWLLGAQFLQKPSRPAGLTQPLRIHLYCLGLPDMDRVDLTDAMLATDPASDLLSSSSSLDREARPRRGVGGSVSIGGGLTRPDGVVSNEFRPALVRADGGSRLGPWLRFERALSGWPASASGRRPWPRAEPARMVGGFRRLALVRGVSSSVRCAAVAMVLVGALRLSFSAKRVR
jgi:hypothetical protein